MPLDTSEISRRWGTAMRVRRAELDINQADLAARTGIPQQAISDIERGKTWPTHERRVAIAAALDTTHDTLFPVDLRAVTALTASGEPVEVTSLDGLRLRGALCLVENDGDDAVLRIVGTDPQAAAPAGRTT